MASCFTFFLKKKVFALLQSGQVRTKAIKADFVGLERLLVCFCRVWPTRISVGIKRLAARIDRKKYTVSFHTFVGLYLA